MGYILAQAFGLLSAVGTLVGPLWKKKWQMLVTSLVATGCVVINLALLGQFGGAIITNLIAMAQVVVSLFHVAKESRVRPWEKVLFLVLFVVLGIVGIVTAEGFVPDISLKNLIEILPLIGAVFFMLATFVRDEQTTRLYNIANATMWMIYFTVIGSTSVVAQVISFFANITAFIKYRKKIEYKNAQ